MESSSLLFVYGTLKRGLDNRYSRRLWSCADDLGAAATAGRLYRVGLYGALVDATVDGQLVHGQVARLHDVGLLTEMDRYEGSQYQRVLRRVVLEGGEVAHAWLYLYTGALAGARRIETGRWPLQ